MGACISMNKACACSGNRRRSSSTHNQPNVASDAGATTEPLGNNLSLTSLENNANNTPNNQYNTNPSENDSLNNLAMSMINNSISYYSTSSNPQPILIGSTMTNPSYYHSSNNVNGSPFVPPTGKNRKLKKDFIKNFKFDKKITEAQLNTKREEFWDTAPAFEGKIEIWTALRAAVEAYEQKNYQLAQVIIDSANIILPKGSLNDCYDELGNRYQIPIYVLAKPVNMRRCGNGQVDNNDQESCVGGTGIENDDSSLSPVGNKKQSVKSDSRKKIFQLDAQDDEDDDEDEIDDFNLNSLNIQKTKSSFFKNKLRFSKVKNNASNLIGSTSFSFETTKKDSKTGKDENNNTRSSPQQATTNSTSPIGSNLQRSNSIEDFFQIKVRLSHLAYSENELKLRVTASQTVRQLKQQIQDATNVEPARLRMFFGGKMMKDRQHLRVYKLRRNVVVQVIVREPKPSELVVQGPLHEAEAIISPMAGVL